MTGPIYVCGAEPGDVLEVLSVGLLLHHQTTLKTCMYMCCSVHMLQINIEWESECMLAPTTPPLFPCQTLLPLLRRMTDSPPIPFA